MKQFPYLLWNRNQISVPTTQELDVLLDKLTSEIKDGISQGVQLVVNDATGLLITIGSSLSHVEFYDSNGHPPVVGYLEDSTNNSELFHFFYEGEPSSVKKRSCVPIETAREALRLYLLTGQKPTNIEWQR